jgi:hypothetical protein
VDGFQDSFVRGGFFVMMMMVDVAVTVMMMRARLFNFGTTRTTTTSSSSSVLRSRRVGAQSRRGNRFPFLVMNGVVAVVFAGGIR